MSNLSNDRNLLFGILALQMDFIDRNQLVDALHAWVLDKSKPLGDLLLEKGFLPPKRRQLLEELVQEHLEQHDNDAEQSLSALGPIESARKDLEKIVDDEVQRTISKLGQDRGHSDVPATASFTIGEATSLGQRFRILRAHAEGGLGKVSVALDQELHREVALKELKSFHADNMHSRARFVLEAEISGGLEHPGIVPVYGLGQYADGRPYYAMRFIRGHNMKDAIDRFQRAEKAGRDPGERSLELRQLLGRLVDVCQAVHYAHSRGVFHRDLKPGNVMLGKYGETLVVDWGLAKAAGRSPATIDNEEATLVPSSGSSSVPTEMGKVLGTPAFMSPEQAEGKWDRVGPPSDVYSLGATLYQMLVGKQAFEGKNTTEILTKVRAGDFVRPRAIHPTVPKALEAVCLKAMALRPKDRYPNAAALADDIEHWLADEPVSAHRDSLMDRGTRWLRHHRSWAVAGAVALLAITAIFITATIVIDKQKRRAVAARKEAVQRFQQARFAVDTWLTGISDILRYYPGMQHFRTTLLEQAAEDYEGFAQQYGDDIEIEMERGRSYLRLGELRGDYLSAPGEAQLAYRQAAAIFDDVTARQPDLLDGHLGGANARTKLGITLCETGDYSEAEQAFADALSKLQELVAARPTESRVHEALGIALTNRALMLIDMRDLPQAESLLGKAIDNFELAGNTDRRDSQHREGMANAQYVLGQLLADTNRPAEALQRIERALTSFDELAESTRSNPTYLRGRATARIYLAGVLQLLGDWSKERQAYTDAIVDYEALVAAYPDVPLFAEDLALARTDLGQMLYERGHTSEAEESLTLARQSLEQLAADSPSVPRYQGEQAACLDMLGEVFSDLGRRDQAQDAFQAALKILESLAADFLDEPLYRERLAVTKSHLGQVLHKQGDHQAAREAFDSASAILQQLIEQIPEVASQRNELGFVLNHLGELLRETGASAEATEIFARAGANWRDLIEQESSPAPAHLRNLAWFLATCADPPSRDPQLAVRMARQAVAAAPRNPRFHTALGAALFRIGDFPAASKALEDAMRLGAEGSACDWFFLSMTQQQLGDAEKARLSFQSGRQWMNERRPDNLELKRIRQEAASMLGIE